ncbi:MAG: glutamate 5-kinase [bacterium]
MKVGTATLTAGAHALSRKRISTLAREIANARLAGKEIVLVSSGAIVGGMEHLGLKEKPRNIPEKQAAAAVGQNHLMDLYTAAFKRHGVKVGQILLTHADMSDRGRFLNARATLLTLLRHKIVPIVNENDTVSVEEIKFGDNDALAAATAHLVGADMLIILTDTDGIFDKDPRNDKTARPIPILTEVDKKSISMMAKTRGPLGTGGVLTKLKAAHNAARFGVPTVIANGSAPSVLARILSGEEIGTLCLPSTERLSSRKSWIAYHLRPLGSVIVDGGALAAVKEKGKSLLPSGIIGVEGNFKAGDPVRLMDSHREVFAHGLAGYTSDELKKIKGAKSSEIAELLGYKSQDEAIHRDNLVII